MASPGGGSRALSAGALWTSGSPTESVGATLAVGKLNYEYPLVNENLGRTSGFSFPKPCGLGPRQSKAESSHARPSIALPGPSPDPRRAPGAKLRAYSHVAEHVLPAERVAMSRRFRTRDGRGRA